MTEVTAMLSRLDSQADMAEVVLVLAQRWAHAREENEKYGGQPRTFTSGRMEGYVQAISLMTGIGVPRVRGMLRAGNFVT